MPFRPRLVHRAAYIERSVTVLTVLQDEKHSGHAYIFFLLLPAGGDCFLSEVMIVKRDRFMCIVKWVSGDACFSKAVTSEGCRWRHQKRDMEIVDLEVTKRARRIGYCGHCSGNPGSICVKDPKEKGLPPRSSSSSGRIIVHHKSWVWMYPVRQWIGIPFRYSTMISTPDDERISSLPRDW